MGDTTKFVHGGLSLQEAIVPVVTLKLAKPEEVEIKVVDYDTGEVVSKGKKGKLKCVCVFVNVICYGYALCSLLPYLWR